MVLLYNQPQIWNLQNISETREVDPWALLEGGLITRSNGYFRFLLFCEQWWSILLDWDFLNECGACRSSYLGHPWITLLTKHKYVPEKARISHTQFDKLIVLVSNQRKICLTLADMNVASFSTRSCHFFRRCQTKCLSVDLAKNRRSEQKQMRKYFLTGLANFDFLSRSFSKNRNGTIRGLVESIFWTRKRVITLHPCSERFKLRILS